MHKKLTVTIDQEVYEGLHKVLGPRHISQFIESLVRPHVISSDLFSVYQEMAEDERREKEALEWSEGLMVTSEFQKQNSDSPLLSEESKRGGQDRHKNADVTPVLSFAPQNYRARRGR